MTLRSARKRLIPSALAALAFAVLASPALAAPGDYLVVDQNADAAGKLYRVTPDGSTAVEIPTGDKLGEPVAAVFGPDRALYVVDQSIPSVGPGIWRVVLGSDPVVFSSGLPFMTPEDIAYNPVRGEFDVVDSGANGLIRVDPGTGAATQFVNGSFTSKPSGIAVAPDGSVYVADPDANYGGAHTGGVFHYANTASPTEEAVAHNAGAATTPFSDPTGIAVRPNGHLIVADGPEPMGFSPGHLIDVNPAISDPTTAGSAINFTAPAGPGSSPNPLSGPRGLAIAGNGDVLVADPTGPYECWAFTGSCGGAPTNHEGIIGRLDASNNLTFPGGKTAVQLNANFVDPIDIAVIPNTPPVAALSVPSSAVTGQAVLLDASGSSDADGDPLTMTFDTDGNGTYETPSPGATMSAVYPVEGTYNVSVRVEDTHGGVAFSSAPLNVVQGSPPPPTDTGSISHLDPPPPGTTPPPTPNQDDQTIYTAPATITLGQLAGKGLTIPITCTSDCTVEGLLSLSKTDLGSLTSASRLIIVGHGVIKLKAGKKNRLHIVLDKKWRKKLRIALKSAGISARRKIVLHLTMQTKYKNGKRKRIRRKIILRA